MQPLCSPARCYVIVEVSHCGMLSSHTNWVQCGPNPGELVHRALWPPCRASLVDEARRWAPCRLSAIQAVCVCEVWSFAGFFSPLRNKEVPSFAAVRKADVCSAKLWPTLSAPNASLESRGCLLRAYQVFCLAELLSGEGWEGAELMRSPPLQ